MDVLVQECVQQSSQLLGLLHRNHVTSVGYTPQSCAWDQCRDLFYSGWWGQGVLFASHHEAGKTTILSEAVAA
jgi:hypothetical protein